MDTRLGASPRHGGAGKFFYFIIPNPPRGRPVGGGGSHRTWGGGNYLLIIAEMEDFHRKFSNSRGEHITCNMAITRDPTTGTISVDNPVEDINWEFTRQP